MGAAAGGQSFFRSFVQRESGIMRPGFKAADGNGQRRILKHHVILHAVRKDHGEIQRNREGRFRAVDENQTKGERFAFARVWKKLVERIDAVAQNGHGIRFERAVFVGRFGGVIDQRMRFGGNAIGFGERFAVKRIARDGGQRAIRLSDEEIGFLVVKQRELAAKRFARFSQNIRSVSGLALSEARRKP